MEILGDLTACIALFGLYVDSPLWRMLCCMNDKFRSSDSEEAWILACQRCLSFGSGVGGQGVRHGDAVL